MTILVLNSRAAAAPIVTGLGQCVAEALALTPAGVPDRVCLLVPSAQITHDNCDCGGQLALAIRQVYESESFPIPYQGNAHKCGPKFTVVEAVVSVTRCVHTIVREAPNTFIAPECDDLLDDAVQLDWDRVAVRQALHCCLAELANPTLPTVRAYMVAPTLMLTESGACSGSETPFMFALGACSCP